jgi:hypothetical protein
MRWPKISMAMFRLDAYINSSTTLKEVDPTAAGLGNFKIKFLAMPVYCQTPTLITSGSYS